MDNDGHKHGPRLDEQIEREVRERTRRPSASGRFAERRQPEPPVDGEPDIPAVGRPDETYVGGPALVMSEEDIAGRSRLGTYLPRSAFPNDRDGLLAAARAARAPDDVIDDLVRLPEGVTFDTVARVWSALGHPMDQRF
jgi:hypothetical protein